LTAVLDTPRTLLTPQPGRKVHMTSIRIALMTVLAVGVLVAGGTEAQHAGAAHVHITATAAHSGGELCCDDP
jgi:hypothetical protein